ncbi:MAG: DegT/DnrJ/EryC1/StrS family aminotransferase [Bacteroidetes bacterium]|nr:MAG: DegT/DnrJ/EryC1/StrS family aminotransferase [Bacteroidota bacterium]
MRPIQMVDLQAQFAKIKTEVMQQIEGVLDSAAFINGAAVQQFAQEMQTYLGVKHVIPCANGTDALQIAMMALGLEPGDEVITPSFTYIATTEVVALLRLKPVFVEVDKDTFCMNPESFRKAITPKTKAVVPVHLYGHAAAMEQILAIAKEHNLCVIEDNAQAIGGTYIFSDGTQAKTGTLGDIGCTSFFPSKNLGGYGDGGAMFTNDDALAQKLKMIANHGQQKRYYHELVGCNSRLDTLQAAILRIKLRDLDNYIAARTAAADYYDAAFANHPKITTPFRAAYSKHVFHQYTLTLHDVNRDALNAYLAEKAVPSMIYYPVPGHKQQMFANQALGELDLPITDWLTERVISLPMHTELLPEQLEYITKTVLDFVNNN